MKIARRLVLFAAVVVPWVLAGCGGGSSGSATPTVADGPVTTRSTYGPLEFTLSAPKTVYKRGETALLVFTIRNTSTNPVYIPEDEAPFESLVTQNGKIVLPPGGRGGGVINPVTIAPGETRTYPTGWAQINVAGEAVPSGKYQFSAYLRGGQFTEQGSKNLLFSNEQSQQPFGPPPIELVIQ